MSELSVSVAVERGKEKEIVDAVVDVIDTVAGGKFGRFMSISAWEASRPRGRRVR